MARKLLCLVALISLVLLTQAPPGFAATYQLSTGDASYGAWTEVHGQGGNSYPGDANGSFTLMDLLGFVNNYYPQYKMLAMSNPSQGKVLSSDNNWVTYQIVYNTRVDTTELEIPTFQVSGYDGPDINANNIVITTTATYAKKPGTDIPLYAPDLEGVYHYYLKDGTMSMTGYGQNSDEKYFALEGQMKEFDLDGQHSGYFSSFTLTYDVAPPVTPGTSAVPIPGAVWLLGSGLFGIACLRPRLRR